MTAVVDLFAAEFGWTKGYTLDELSGAEVFALTEAIAARYELQAAAMDDASADKPGHGPGHVSTTDFTELVKKHPEGWSLDG